MAEKKKIPVLDDFESIDKEFENKVRKTREAINDGFFQGFPDVAHRIRRNLLFFVSIALTYKISNLEISNFNFLGVSFEEFDYSIIVDKFLFCTLLYHSVYFLWHCFHAWQEWNFYKLKNEKFESMFRRAYVPSKEKGGEMLSDAEKIIDDEMSKVIKQFDSINVHYFIRWLIIEAGLPLGLSLLALCKLAPVFWGGS